MSDPLFTGDDYQLVADAAYREEDRRELFMRWYGFDAPPADHLDRLTDLCHRINLYLRQTGQAGEPAAGDEAPGG